MKNYKKAIYWLEKAAEYQDIKSMLKLAYLYDEGAEGVAVDREQALILVKRAYFSSSKIINAIAGVVSEGEDESVDDKYFVNLWLEKEAEHGNSHAQYDLAVILGSSESWPLRDISKSVMLFVRSACVEEFIKTVDSFKCNHKISKEEKLQLVTGVALLQKDVRQVTELTNTTVTILNRCIGGKGR